MTVNLPVVLVLAIVAWLVVKFFRIRPWVVVALVLFGIVMIGLTQGVQFGLHARAAARFVTLAEQFGASVDVLKDGQVISARSIMGLMMLGAARGADIELRAEGWDAKEALDALEALVEAGFNEQD